MASTTTTAAILVVAARRTVGSLYALHDGLLVVAFIVQLPCELVPQNLEGLTQQLEVRLVAVKVVLLALVVVLAAWWW